MTVGRYVIRFVDQYPAQAMSYLLGFMGVASIYAIPKIRRAMGLKTNQFHKYTLESKLDRWLRMKNEQKH